MINVDQPLLLSGFRATLQSLEPALRGSIAEFDGAIAAIFEAMAGPLAGAEDGDWLTARMPAATFEVWPDLGHYPHLIEQQRFID